MINGPFPYESSIVLVRRYSLLVMGILFSSITSSGWAQNHAQRGAVAGGTAGAIIGGIIGNQNNETPEGILIGGALGALAGGLAGSEHDQQIRRQQYFQQQHSVAIQNAVSINDVVAMTRNGVDSNVIVNQIQLRGVQQRIGVNEIISLHQQGVSNQVIEAMQHTPLATTPVRQVQPEIYARPVIVEPVFLPPPRYCPPVRPHYHSHRPPPAGTSFYFQLRR